MSLMEIFEMAGRLSPKGWYCNRIWCRIRCGQGFLMVITSPCSAYARILSHVWPAVANAHMAAYAPKIHYSCTVLRREVCRTAKASKIILTLSMSTKQWLLLSGADIRNCSRWFGLIHCAVSNRRACRSVLPSWLQRKTSIGVQRIPTRASDCCVVYVEIRLSGKG